VDRMLEASREIIISHQNSVKSLYFHDIRLGIQKQ